MNNYDLIEVIGEGTYGIVYKCRDRRTNQIVAVKQFKNFQTNAYIRCTMLRELRVEQLLKGEPNVTQLLETFKQKNRLYLVMEYIPRSLLDVLEEHHRGLAEDNLRVLLYTLLLGVQSCHRSGIIHRDIKPENILVRGDGTASLCDFGFCRPVLQQQQQQQQQQRQSQPPQTKQSAWSSSTPTYAARSKLASGNGAARTPGSPSLVPPPGSTAASAFLSELVLADHRGAMTDYVATRWYRSPEMLLGMTDYGYAVDMWAVGAIMAEAIDGEPLLPGKTELEQLSLIQTRVGEFPAAYEAAVRKRNGGMLHLRSFANPFAKQQARARVKLSSGAGDPLNNSSNDNNSSSSSSGVDYDTISSYLSMRYGGRIRKAGMHLLARLLCVDALGRLSVEEALAHPYFDDLRGDPRFTSPILASPPSTKKASSPRGQAHKDDDGAANQKADVLAKKEEQREEEEEASLTAFTRQATSSTQDVTASTGPLPPLSPTAQTPIASFFSSAAHHGSFSRAAVDRNSTAVSSSTGGGGGTTLLFQRGKNTAGRPPRATEVEAHTSNDADVSISGSAMDVSLPSPSSSSAWQSTATSPRLAALSQRVDGPLPPLDGREASSGFVSTAEEPLPLRGSNAGSDDDDNDSDLDGNSPPPRPVQLPQAVPESGTGSPLLRRHAASEGTSSSTHTTTTATTFAMAPPPTTTSLAGAAAGPPHATHATQKSGSAFAKGNHHVATLLFKTKKGKAAMDAVLGNRRSSQSEESAASASVSTSGLAAGPGSPFLSRFPHGLASPANALAPLRRRSSDNGGGGGGEASATEPERDGAAQSNPHSASPPLSLPTTVQPATAGAGRGGSAANSTSTVIKASDSVLKSFGGSRKAHGVAQSENFYLLHKQNDNNHHSGGSKDIPNSSGCHDGSRDEDVEVCMSAPRSGGERQAQAESSAHQRTSSYTVQQTQATSNVNVNGKRQKKNMKKAVRPSIRPAHKASATAPQDEPTSSTTTNNNTNNNNTSKTSVANSSSPSKRQMPTEPAAGAAALTERASIRGRGVSSPRRTASQRGGGGGSTAPELGGPPPLSARSPAKKSAAPRSTAGQISPDRTPVAARAAGVGRTGKRKARSPSSPSTAAEAAGEAAARPKSDRSRFASPKLPRVIKPLQPRERMTLLKEIESLGCAVETPTAVEVMVPVRPSPPANDEAEEEESSIKGGDRSKRRHVGSMRGSISGTCNHHNSSANSSAPSSAGSSRSSAAQESQAALAAAAAAAGSSQLTVDGDELFVEDLDSGGDTASRSPLLSEASGLDDGPLSATPPPLSSFAAHDGNNNASTSLHAGAMNVSNAAAAATAGATSAAVQSRPPRMDFGHPTTAANATTTTTTTTTTANNNNNSNSNRAQPSLYFRSSRTAPAPLKLAAIYMSQGTTPPQPLPNGSASNGGGGASGGNNGGLSTSTENTSSPSAYHAGASVATAMQSHTSSTSLSPSFGRRPTPTLLRHPQSKLSTSQPSPPSLPFDLPNGAVGGNGGGGGNGVLGPLNLSHGLNSSSSRTPQDDSPRVPLTSTSLPLHKISSAYLGERAAASQQPPPPPQPSSQASQHLYQHPRQPSEESAGATMADLRAAPRQRRLSANHMSLSVSGDFTHAGSLALSRRSQERMPPLATNPAGPSTPTAVVIPAGGDTPPMASLDDVETEVLVETPLGSPHADGRGSRSPVVATPSPPYSRTTAAMSGGTTRDASIATLQRSTSREASAALRRDGSHRPSSAADLSRTRTSTFQGTPLTRGQLPPPPQQQQQQQSRFGPRRENGDGGAEDDDYDGLPGGAQTISFPLPSSSDRSESLGESGKRSSNHNNNSSSREAPPPPLSLHPPQPVLGGVWVNVDAAKSGQPLYGGPSRKKSRLIL